MRTRGHGRILRGTNKLGRFEKITATVYVMDRLNPKP